jgi:hypothetical protein
MATSSPMHLDGLTALSVSVAGRAVRCPDGTLWKGFLEAESPFVALTMGYLPQCAYWSKSLPSERNRMDLRVALTRAPAEPLHCRLFLGAGSSAFMHQILVRLPCPEFLPRVDLPEQIGAGALVRFLEFPSCSGPVFGLACFAKSDVVVRRKHVWGLKPRLLASARPELAEVLARGRHGCVGIPTYWQYSSLPEQIEGI